MQKDGHENKPRLAWIGAGALATSLSVALAQTQGFTHAVYARRHAQAEALCRRLDQAVAVSWSDMASLPCDMAFLAVSDDAIEAMACKLSMPSNTCLVHVSARVSLSCLRAHHKGPCGVFYPLQTFSLEGLSSFRDVYVFIEGSDAGAERRLVALARALGARPCLLGEAERQDVHVAAVLTHNFSNYLLGVAEAWMKDKKLPFPALEPLMRTMIDHAFSIGPVHAQSGPAKRGDVKTIARHLQLLEARPEWQELYALLTKNLCKRYGHA